ncbi:hypothetical protein Q75_07125 [Bacillus coahuilensis p1.1.43]|uniref:Uncharacterized protein n=1 Tax=Bacillus coahuilensis p1.1.43 TaxID=1150625 RepID=A0A147K972_9BACI|nr:hypothetical protein [Bacillus coahuilensis]KUP06848.1 hypothetical protein Q75_07125 [Bacillus coahuilensis p1.1.43]
MYHQLPIMKSYKKATGIISQAVIRCHSAGMRSTIPNLMLLTGYAEEFILEAMEYNYQSNYSRVRLKYFENAK